MVDTLRSLVDEAAKQAGIDPCKIKLLYDSALDHRDSFSSPVQISAENDTFLLTHASPALLAKEKLSPFVERAMSYLLVSANHRSLEEFSHKWHSNNFPFPSEPFREVALAYRDWLVAKQHIALFGQSFADYHLHGQEELFKGVDAAFHQSEDHYQRIAYAINLLGQEALNTLVGEQPPHVPEAIRQLARPLPQAFQAIDTYLGNDDDCVLPYAVAFLTNCLISYINLEKSIETGIPSYQMPRVWIIAQALSDKDFKRISFPLFVALEGMLVKNYLPGFDVQGAGQIQ